MRWFFTGLRDALAFLTRISLEPAAFKDEFNGSSLGRAVPYYPLVGLIIGCIAALPSLISLPHWLAAWFFALLMAWVTRGLHWDGLADLADATGSNATGDRFWDIMKDSRIGAFGVMGLAFGLGMEVTAARACIEKGIVSPLLLAPAYARAMVILLGHLAKPHPRSTLAALIQPGVTALPAKASLSVTVAITAFYLGAAATLALAVVTAFILCILCRIARKHGGINGDFHGACIIVSEIAVLICASF